MLGLGGFALFLAHTGDLTMDEAAGGCLIVVVIIAIVLGIGGKLSCSVDSKPTTQTIAAPQPKVVSTTAVVIPQAATVVAETASIRESLPDFTYNTFPFWILVSVLVVGLIVGEATEHGWVGLLSMSIFFGIVQWLGGSDPLGYAQVHPKEAALWFTGYFVVIGLPFAVMKWLAETFKVKHERKEAQQEWLQTEGKTGYRIPLSLKDKWEKHAIRNGIPSQPLLRKNKARFIRWIYAWPGSLIWTLFADVFRNIGTFLYNLAGDATQKLSNMVWGDVDKYVDDTPQKPPRVSDL